MIVVVEGISAAGKTTWCRRQAGTFLVAETLPEDRHQQEVEGQGTAQYWTDWNKKRWQEATLGEREHGLVVCDTDPLKLHYCWGLWRIGERSQNQWLLQLEATREAIAAKSLGLADQYFVKEIDPDIARRQKDGDVARVRDRFELHLRLQRQLIAWYSNLETVLGGRVLWEFPETYSTRETSTNPDRYDLDIFDRFVGMLPER